MLASGAAPAVEQKRTGRGAVASRHGVEPIQIAKDAKTARDYAKKERAWAERVLAEPFRKRAEGEPWSASATKFVQRALDRWVSEQMVDDAPEMVAAGDALLKEGCSDPLVRYLTAWAEWVRSGEWHAARRTLREIVPAAEQAEGYRVLPLIVILDFLSASAAGNRDPGSALAQLTTYVGAVTLDGSYGPEDDAILVRHLAGPRWSDVREKCFEEIATGLQNAKLPEWARETFDGAFAVKRAWKSRGSGWANTVTDEGWKGFAKQLGEAREHLVKSWRLRPSDPVAATWMIDVVMGGNSENGETVRTWFDRSTAAECDFVPAYNSLANAYLPRWGGSHEKMLAFGKACVATGRFDTDAPIGFFAILGHMDRDARDIRLLYRDPEIAPTVLRLSKALAEEPSRAGERRSRLCFLAVNAWMVGDFATAASALTKAGPAPFPYDAVNKLRLARLDEAGFRGLVAALNSSGGADVTKAESAFERRDVKSAIAGYRAALAKSDGAATEYLKARLAVVETEQKLASGDWVQIPADPKLLGWIAEKGTWFPTAEGFPASRDDHGPTRIFYGARVGADFEMRGEVSIEGEPATDHVVGLVFAPEFESGTKQRWHGCQAFFHTGPERTRAMYTYRDYTAREIPIVDCDLRPVNQFVIRVQGGRLTWTFNGKTIHEDVPLSSRKGEAPLDAGSRVGIGSYSHHPGITMSLKSLSVRKL